MRVSDIKQLVEYNNWANERVLAKAALLTPAQLDAPSAYEIDPLRQVLLHLLDAEYGWRLRLQYDRGSAVLTEADLPTFETLVARWRTEQAAMRSYLETLTEPDLDVALQPQAPGNSERVRWQYLVHVVNHGTQHRAEAAALLTGFGHSPGDLDFSVFLREQQQ
jgi:uncharacterized damage-inducible protein DinB